MWRGVGHRPRAGSTACSCCSSNTAYSTGDLPKPLRLDIHNSQSWVKKVSCCHSGLHPRRTAPRAAGRRPVGQASLLAQPKRSIGGLAPPVGSRLKAQAGTLAPPGGPGSNPPLPRPVGSVRRIDKCHCCDGRPSDRAATVGTRPGRVGQSRRGRDGARPSIELHRLFRIMWIRQAFLAPKH
jgi:hypothetical protein